MMLELGSDARKVEVVHIFLLEDNAVRVAHGNAGHVVDLSSTTMGALMTFSPSISTGISPRSKNGCTHVHAGGLHFAVLDGQLKRFTPESVSMVMVVRPSVMPLS